MGSFLKFLLTMFPSVMTTTGTTKRSSTMEVKASHSAWTFTGVLRYKERGFRASMNISAVLPDPLRSTTTDWHRRMKQADMTLVQAMFTTMTLAVQAANTIMTLVPRVMTPALQVMTLVPQVMTMDMTIVLQAMTITMVMVSLPQVEEILDTTPQTIAQVVTTVTM